MKMKQEKSEEKGVNKMINKEMINSPTKQKIADAFLSLLAQKPFASIKAKDIVDAAGVSHMTFYRNFSDKFDLVKSISYDNLALFVKIYGRNAEWRASAICMLNTIRNNSLFFGKILKDEEATTAFMTSMCEVSSNITGACASKATYNVWRETMQNWAKEGFSTPVEEIYATLVGAMPLHEVFTGEDLKAAIHAYETNTLDDFRNRLKEKKEKAEK